MSTFSWVYKQYTFSHPLPLMCTDQHFGVPKQGSHAAHLLRNNKNYLIFETCYVTYDHENSMCLGYWVEGYLADSLTAAIQSCI